jgi:Flp pilus assembly protein CpaB
MARLVAIVIGLAVISGVAWKVLSGTSRSAPPEATQAEPSAPKRTLDNVRGAAKNIEAADQQQVDEVEKKAFGE